MKVMLCWVVHFILPWIASAGDMSSENKTNYIVTVNQTSGTDDSTCAEQHQSCKTLEMVSKLFQRNCSNLIVHIEGIVYISDVITFINCSFLSLVGTDSTASISCISRVEYATGFQFEHVQNLKITQLKFKFCGYRISLAKFNSTAAMHIHHSTNIEIEETTFLGSVYTALVLSDNSNQVMIQNSSFLDTSKFPQESANVSFYPGGIHIQLNTIEHAKYVIQNNLFRNNTQLRWLSQNPRLVLSPSLSAEYGYGLGGGMGILFKKNTHNINLLISDCEFVSNMAHSGAGLYIHFEEETDGNSVDIVHSHFINNNGTAGGGLTIGMETLKGKGNQIHVSGCEFVNNTGEYGVGTTIFLIHTDRLLTESMRLIIFTNSIWTNNSGYYSPAVDILPFRGDQFNSGYLPTPVFTNCTFSYNKVNCYRNEATIHTSSGVFVVSSTSVYLAGTITFIGNQNTALKLTSGRVHLEKEAEVYFESNVGNYGGAISLYGSSAIVGNENSLLSFYNNSALVLGGGIYYETIEQREFIEGKSCFLQNSAITNTKKGSFKLIFVNNSASYGGTSIHAISFYSCYYTYLGDLEKHSLMDFLKYVGTFNFSDSVNDSQRSALGTTGMQFHYDRSHKITAVPGEVIEINISISDEFNNPTKSILFWRRETAELGNSTIFSNHTTKVFGREHEKASYLLTTENTIRNSHVKIIVEFLPCPPGFYFEAEENACRCTTESKKHALNPIVKCNNSIFRAYILSGYWAGMYSHNNSTNLYVSSLSRFLPIYSISRYRHLRLLPKNANDLDHFFCGVSRQGILCGECKKGYSTFYHSKSYKCGSERHCHLGVLFYGISELIPVVLLFMIIIYHNIHFQSGYLNGLIFYYQIASITFIDINKLPMLSFNPTVVKIMTYLQQICQLLSDVVNLEFFSIESLSFCLWKGGKVMDIISFRYVTTFFTFLLVFALVRIMNSKCFAFFSTKIKPNYSVVSGLSGFLILSYSQCTITTFQILNKDAIVNSQSEIPVTNYGGLPYFRAQHLIYAVPAIVCLCTLISLPLFYLLAVPLVLRISRACPLSEHKFITIFLKLMCQQKLMPLFDAFHSCFKPELRFFAGVYFVYRFAIFAALTFTKNETELFAVMELIFLLILGLHAIAQPYKEKKLNMIDGFLFLNLAILNGVNIFVTVSSAYHYDQNTDMLAGLFFVQIILVLLPLIGITVAQCLKRCPKRRPLLQDASYDDIRDTSLLKSSEEYNLHDRSADTY